MIRLECQECGNQFVAKAEEAGATCKCPQCAAPVAIDSAGTMASPLPAPVSFESEFVENTPVFGPQTLPSDTATATIATEDVPGFEVICELGRGGMGVVYKARHIKLNRIVALKMILTGGHASAKDKIRFLSEAEAVAAFQHPNVVQVFEIGEHQGLPYMALEFVGGGSLADKIGSSPMTAAEAVRVVEQIARGMNAAHQSGFVHRDLKPANVLLTNNGVPIVTDFGLAKKVDGSSGLTHTGAIMGTPSYMAPEQAGGEGKRVGPAADVYALGAILYACLTGRPPFQADSLMHTIQHVIRDEPKPPRQLNHKIPADLETICLKCLEKDPLKRYASAHDLAEDLRCWQNGEPITARRVGWAERTTKWMRRNSVVAALLFLVIVALLLGSAVSTWFGIQAQIQAAAADHNATVAKQKAEAEKNARRKERMVAQKLALQVDETNNALNQAKMARLAEKKRAQELAQQIKETNKALDKAHFVNYAFNINAARQAAWRGDYVAARQNLETTERELRGWEYDFVYRQSLPRASMIGHTAAVNGVAFSPDGKRIVSCSGDRTAKAWDANTGKKIFTFKGHATSVNSVDISSDGRWIVSGSADKTVKVWDANTGEVILTFTGHTSSVSSVAFSADGRRIVSGSGDKMVKVWDVKAGKEVHTLKGHNNSVNSVAFSPDGTRIVSASRDRTARVWDANTGKEIHTLTKHSNFVTSAAFSPDGKWIASGSADNTVRIWHSNTGKEALTLKGHANQVLDVTFSPDGKRIVSASKDETVKVWDANTGQNVITFRFDSAQVSSVRISPDGKRIVTGSPDKTVKVWDANTEEEITTFKGHANIITSVAFSPDSKGIVTGSWDNRVRVWNTENAEKNMMLRGHADVVTSVGFSPDGKWIVSGSFDDTAKIWDSVTGRDALTLRGHAGTVSSVGFSPDGKRIVTGSNDKTVKVWDAATGRVMRTFTGHDGAVSSVEFSPDGKQIASGSSDKTIKVWNAATGRETLTLLGHHFFITSVRFSPDGKQIVSGSSDQTAKVGC